MQCDPCLISHAHRLSRPGRLLCWLFLWSLLLSEAGGQILSLDPGAPGHNQVEISTGGAGETIVRTTGTDPYIVLQLNGGLRERGTSVLSMEYFSLQGSRFVQVFLTPGPAEHQSLMAPGIEPSQGWSRWWVDLTGLLNQRDRTRIRGLRIDLGNQSGHEFRFRRLELRDPTAAESRILEQGEELERAEARAGDALLRELNRDDYPGVIRRADQTARGFRLRGRIDTGAVKGRQLHLYGFPLHAGHESPGDPIHALPFETDSGGQFDIELRTGDDDPTDPLIKWAVMADGGGAADVERISPFHHVDGVVCRNDYPEEVPFNRKGLGAWGPGRPETDLGDLGVSAVTVNVLLNSLIRLAPCEDCEPFDYRGTTWYVHLPTLEKYDGIIGSASARGLIVSAILLVPQAGGFSDPAAGKMMAHADAHPSGIFVMPAVDTDEGVGIYAAAIDVLARRYGRTDRKFGRVHYWIIHNEVNSGWVWTNAGKKSSLRFMELYVRSMRIVHLLTRQYNPHSKVFISLDHHWTSRHGDMGYGGREVVEHLMRFSRREGNFEWAVAHHPYPQSLFRPEVWDDTEATDSFDTPKITFHNLQVLERWFLQDEYLFDGSPRVIHLSEQGLNSPDYSEQSLENQAAGMAYAWMKMKPLRTIRMFHYHNWVDNRHEGGLRIGLRRFPDDPEAPLGKKPIWHVFKALGTPGENEAIEFALPVIGIESWDELNDPRAGEQ